MHYLDKMNIHMNFSPKYIYSKNSCTCVPKWWYVQEYSWQHCLWYKEMEQIKFPSAEHWISKWWYIDTMEFYSTMKISKQ